MGCMFGAAIIHDLVGIIAAPFFGYPARDGRRLR